MPDTKKSTKRKVYPTDELPHLWFHKSQSEARNSSGNVFFENETIFSYGRHFPIARHVTVGKTSAVLFTTKSYSVTTSRHMSYVRRAIPSSAVVFNVPCLDPVDHAANLAHLVDESKTAIEKAARSRNYAHDHSVCAFGLRDTARQYAKFFRAACPRFPFLPTGKKLVEFKARIAERQAQAWAIAEQRAALRMARRAEQDRIDSLELPEKIALWRSGQYVRLPYGVETLLRIEGAEVVTSKGARIPVSHAKRGLRFVLAIIKSGVEYVANGHTLHLGHYSIDKITADGTLTAGCHVIKFDEIQNLIPALDAVTVTDEVEVSNGN